MLYKTSQDIKTNNDALAHNHSSLSVLNKWQASGDELMTGYQHIKW